MFEEKENRTYLIGSFHKATVRTGTTILPSNSFRAKRYSICVGEHEFCFINAASLDSDILHDLRHNQRDDIHLMLGDLSQKNITLKENGVFQETKPELIDDNHITFLVGDFSKASVRTGDLVHYTVPPKNFNNPMHDIIVNGHKYRFIKAADISNASTIDGLDNCVDVYKFPENLDDLIIVISSDGLHVEQRNLPSEDPIEPQ